jgi:hypothetical protein
MADNSFIPEISPDLDPHAALFFITSFLEKDKNKKGRTTKGLSFSSSAISSLKTRPFPPLTKGLALWSKPFYPFSYQRLSDLSIK